ncbi:hypothetical protein [Streptomyces sp. MH13]|uniref:hypothetical protein n=1 Tax=unclassified Streptomyces TaxID=2593676 RepID=UPI003CF3AD3D
MQLSVANGQFNTVGAGWPPNDDTLLRLVTAVLELHDEWIAFPRRYLPEGSMDQLYPAERSESAPELPNTTNTTSD